MSNKHIKKKGIDSHFGRYKNIYHILLVILILGVSVVLGAVNTFDSTGITTTGDVISDQVYTDNITLVSANGSSWECIVGNNGAFSCGGTPSSGDITAIITSDGYIINGSNSADVYPLLNITKILEIGNSSGWNLTYNGTQASIDYSDATFIPITDLPLENRTLIHCDNITGATSDLCTLTSSAFNDSYIETITVGDGNLTVTSSGQTRTISLNSTANIEWLNDIYAPISVTGDNSSWNQTLADTLYQSIGNIYNLTYEQTYNLTYHNLAYNHTAIAEAYADANDDTGGNETFNQTLTDSLYADIQWGYNMTTPAISYADAQDTGYNLSLTNYIDSEILGVSYTNGSGIDLTDGQFNHSDTSSQASEDNSDNTFIQDITLDTFGHVTALVSTAISNIITNATSGWTLDFLYINSSDWTNVSITESQITDLTHTVDTQKEAGGIYLTNDSTTISLNEEQLNATIDDRDLDTTYTAGANITIASEVISLNGTSTFQWIEDIFAKISDLADYILSSEEPNLNVNSSQYVGNSDESALLSTFNATYDANQNNATFNQTLTDTLYAGIEWDYNQTNPAISYADATFLTSESDTLEDVADRNATVGSTNITLATDVKLCFHNCTFGIYYNGSGLVIGP